MWKSDDIGELALALAKAQSEMDFAKKDSSNPFFKSSYADLASVWDVCRQVLPKNEISVSQLMVPVETGICVRTVLMHKSGQWISGELILPPTKNDPQAFGSAVTYARRYSLAAIVGVVADDDDGERAMGRGGKKTAPTPRQKAQPPAKPEALATTPQIRKLFATAREMFIPDDELKRIIQESYGVESTKQLTSSHISALIDSLSAIQPGSNDPADPHDAPADSTSDTSGEVPPSPPDDLSWWEVVPTSEEESIKFWTQLDSIGYYYLDDMDDMAKSVGAKNWRDCESRGDKLVKIARAMHDKGWL